MPISAGKVGGWARPQPLPDHVQPSDLTPGRHSFMTRTVKDYGARIVTQANYWTAAEQEDVPPVKRPEVMNPGSSCR